MKEFVIHFYFSHTFLSKCVFSLWLLRKMAFIYFNVLGTLMLVHFAKLQHKSNQYMRGGLYVQSSFIIAIIVSKSIYTYECSYTLKWFYRSFCKNCNTTYYYVLAQFTTIHNERLFNFHQFFTGFLNMVSFISMDIQSNK